MPTNFLPDFPDALSDHVVVCGLGRFGLRIVQLLREQKIAVVAITSSETREDRRVAALDLGAQLITGDFRFPDTREAGRLESARALILATSDDLINLETALDVRSQHPELCLVMRHSDARLGDRLEHDFDITHVLVPPCSPRHTLPKRLSHRRPSACLLAREATLGSRCGLHPARICRS